MTDASAAATYAVDRLWPDPELDLDLDSAMAGFDLPQLPPDRPLVAINMVTSVDGRAQLDGTRKGSAAGPTAA